jgi:hypothetical protein
MTRCVDSDPDHRLVAVDLVDRGDEHRDVRADLDRFVNATTEN